MSFIESIKEYLGEKTSVQMVADDEQMAAEMLLLIRMMFADGELKGEELVYFKTMCNRLFGIPEEDMPKVLKYLKDFGYETTPAQAASAFTDMPLDRRHALLRHMAAMARADDQVHPREIQLIHRTGEVLGFTPEQVATITMT